MVNAWGGCLPVRSSNIGAPKGSLEDMPASDPAVTCRTSDAQCPDRMPWDMSGRPVLSRHSMSAAPPHVAHLIYSGEAYLGEM